MLSTGDSSHPAVDTTAPNPRHKHPSATSKVPAIWRAHADATGTAASHAIGTRAVASPGGSLASASAWRERPARVGRHCSSRLSAIATTSSSVRPTARASSTSCLCTACNAVGPSGASVARPERARRGCRREAPHPRGSTSLSATLGSCNRLPLFAPALAANGIPVSDRPCPAIRAERVAGWWPCGYSSREETGAGPTWRPRGARCPGRPWTRATASFREGVPHR
jgi:hypothetical protein